MCPTGCALWLEIGLAATLRAMDQNQFYTQIFGITHPWAVADVLLNVKDQEVTVLVDTEPSIQLVCPECNKASPRYDKRPRRWRHLDTCQFMTTIEADVPRVTCPEHGVLQVSVPWAERNSGFTALFECLVINWLKEASIQAVADLCRMSWSQVDTILKNAVERGLLRREQTYPERLGVDETSFQKRHEYVTVVTDMDTSTVLYVADNRKAESLEGFFKPLTDVQRAAIRVVAMDMHQPFIKVVTESLHDGYRKIAFDRFHVAKHLGEAVDQVRRQEHQQLMERGDQTLKGSKYLWLMNPESIDNPVQVATFEALKECALKTGRAWTIKETARELWGFASTATAEKRWKQWIAWAIRCRLEPIKKAAAMIRNHLQGILTAVVTKTTNAASESINSKIQWIKRTACGFRNRNRFRNAIYFHLGNLDLYPASVGITHTKS